ncbi:MAG TPA: alanine--tRNA ligase [Bacteroidales bacterium]|nr:alanine--tRNA ligase [Bacteroidales bacterium]
MNSKKIRNTFLNFFYEKNHTIVSSAPMVVKDDPTLMFINAGMNQFKDIFLGNEKPKNQRVTDSQKCMRVSGKHNDLEEVGHDTYHHTMFEMLGNWSFGDYFKEEAIAWAYEFLVDVLGISNDRLYATVFEGDSSIGVDADEEARSHWIKHLPADRIMYGSKEDNFWEMGETGPCGPCSEIHIDLRSDEERKKIAGRELVNQDHPLVIELWNLVFIQFNQKASGELETLPEKHVDTGMGFERLCLVMQDKASNYDTDIFQPIIQHLSKLANRKYGQEHMTDVAMRVVSDHLRAIAFSVADGQLPSNNKAGYVIRRILRRAVRYGYTYLNFKEPFIYKLLPILIEDMGDAYPELNSQKELIEKVIREEENAFLKTLDTGIRMLDSVIDKTLAAGKKEVDGKTAFELYDTYGFPLDLTELILKEKGMTLNRGDFDKELQAQKSRSRQATKIEAGDWVRLREEEKENFIGYDHLEADLCITKYRKVKSKGKDLYQLVFNKTPFYAEAGGQVGDTGHLVFDGEKIAIVDTKKENNQTMHYAKKLPSDPSANFRAVVDSEKRKKTANNHSSTHLLHQALKEVLGNHVEQKGSLVHPDYLRFDFSHFQKLSKEEIEKIERIVNFYIRRNIPRHEERTVPFEEAKKKGATALFGEKYGDTVRVVQFGDIIELCGGTHVEATGQIGFFKVTGETAISAGIRRIEAVTADKAEEYIHKNLDTLEEVRSLMNNPSNLPKSVEKLIKDNASLNKQIENLLQDKVNNLKQELINQKEQINGINYIGSIIHIDSAGAMKDMAFQMKNEVDNLVLLLGANIEGKANLSMMISENLVKEKNLNAGEIIREAAKEIKGGGGGQAFFATAGGKNPDGLGAALEKGRQLLMQKVKE